MSDHEITTNDIILALRYCDNVPCKYCEVCPYAIYGRSCITNLMTDAADTIKHLTSLRSDI